MPSRPNRRRAMTLLASLGASLVAPRALGAQTYEWRGTALGADATLILADADRESAEQATAACLAEVDRLEEVFSLHRPGSEISRLNRDGVLAEPSMDLRMVLGLSQRLHRSTEGLFDPTVQPLWRHHASGADVSVRDDVEAERLLRCVGLGRVSVSPQAIAMERGTEITLNGIAQGYITERVAGILRGRGWRSVLVDLGEALALGERPFYISVAQSGLEIPLAAGALATSRVDSLWLREDAGIGHVLHPLSGRTPHHWQSVTVRHASAAIADGVSTALVLADREQTRRILGRIPDATAWATDTAGATVSI